MAIYYVGPGGSDAQPGTSWAQRRLTISAGELLLAAGDTLYIAPGIYRESVTLSGSGIAGNVITYVGDVTGQNTDGVGGIVRITGSNDDIAAARAEGVQGTSKNYRTFRGLTVDLCSDFGFLFTTCDHIIVEDCVVFHCDGGVGLFGQPGSGNTNALIHRCVISTNTYGVKVRDASTGTGANHTVENCIFLACRAGGALTATRISGWTVRNCTVIGGNYGVWIEAALAAANSITVTNCTINQTGMAFNGTVSGEIVENYNSLYGNGTDRTNTAVGANSDNKPLLLNPPMLSNTLYFAWAFGEPAPYSLLGAIAGATQPTDDFFGRARSSVNAKNSRGAIEYMGQSRNTATVHNGAVSLKLPDAGSVQFIVPVSNVSTSISVYVYRESSYSGTNPQLIIRQPGQAAITVTDASGASQWNQLSTTFTPSATPPYVFVEIASNNTASAGAYAVYVDDLTVG